jgi:hypothetical protein
MQSTGVTERYKVLWLDLQIHVDQGAHNQRGNAYFQLKTMIRRKRIAIVMPPYNAAKRRN